MYFGVGLDQSEMWRSTGSFTCTFAQIIYLPLFKPIMWSFGPAVMPIVEFLYWEFYRKTKSPKDYAGIVIPHKPMIQPDCLGYFYVTFTSTVFLAWFALSLGYIPLLFHSGVFYLFLVLMITMLFPLLLLPTMIFKGYFSVFRCCFFCYGKKEIMDADMHQCQGLANFKKLRFNTVTNELLQKLQPNMTPGDLILFEHMEEGDTMPAWRRGRIVSYESVSKTYSVNFLKDEYSRTDSTSLKILRTLYAYNEGFWSDMVKSILVNEAQLVDWNKIKQAMGLNREEGLSVKIEYYFGNSNTKRNIFIARKAKINMSQDAIAESEEDENEAETFDEEEVNTDKSTIIGDLCKKGGGNTRDATISSIEQNDLNFFAEANQEFEELISQQEQSKLQLTTKLELMTLKSLFVSYITGITIAVSAGPMYYLGARFFIEIPNPLEAIPPITIPDYLTIPELVLRFPNIIINFYIHLFALFWPFPTTLRIEFQFLIIFSMGVNIIELMYLLIWTFYKLSGAYRYKTHLRPVCRKKACERKFGKKNTLCASMSSFIFQPCMKKSPFYWIPIMSLFVPLLFGRIMYQLFFMFFAISYGTVVKFILGWLRIIRPFQRHHLLEEMDWRNLTTSCKYNFLTYPMFADHWILFCRLKCCQKLNCCRKLNKMYEKNKDYVHPSFLFIFVLIVGIVNARLRTLVSDYDNNQNSIFGSVELDVSIYLPFYMLNSIVLPWIMFYYYLQCGQSFFWKKIIEDYGNLGPGFGTILTMFPFIKYLCCISKEERKRNRRRMFNVKQDLLLLKELHGCNISLSIFRQWLINRENLDLKTVDLSHCYDADDTWRKYKFLLKQRYLSFLTNFNYFFLVQDLAVYYALSNTTETKASYVKGDELKILNLSHCPNISDNGLNKLFLYCRKVVEIRLVNCDAVTDDCICNIAKTLGKQLEILDLCYCDKITEKSLKSLSNCKNLKELSLLGCNKLVKLKERDVFMEVNFAAFTNLSTLKIELNILPQSMANEIKSDKLEIKRHDESMKSWIEVEHKTEPIGAGPEKSNFKKGCLRRWTKEEVKEDMLYLKAFYGACGGLLFFIYYYIHYYLLKEYIEGMISATHWVGLFVGPNTYTDLTFGIFFGATMSLVPSRVDRSYTFQMFFISNAAWILHFIYIFPIWFIVLIYGPMLIFLLYRSYVSNEWDKFAHTSDRKFHCGNFTVSIATIVSLVNFIAYPIYMGSQQGNWGRRKLPPNASPDEFALVMPFVLLVSIYWLLLFVAKYNNTDIM